MEWTVVGVIVVLVGLGAAVIKPIVSLTNTITKLTLVVESVKGGLSEMTTKNSASHERLWAKNEEQDKHITEHDMRLCAHDKRLEAVER